MNQKNQSYTIPKDPETYEEAVEILKDSQYDIIHQRAYEGLKKRARVAIAIGTAIAVLAAIAEQEFTLPVLIMAATGMVGGAFLLPMLDLKNSEKAFESGKVFEGVDEEEVINRAKKYLQLYREYAKEHGEGNEL